MARSSEDRECAKITGIRKNGRQFEIAFRAHHERFIDQAGFFFIASIRARMLPTKARTARHLSGQVVRLLGVARTRYAGNRIRDDGEGSRSAPSIPGLCFAEAMLPDCLVWAAGSAQVAQTKAAQYEKGKGRHCARPFSKDIPSRPRGSEMRFSIFAKFKN